MPTGSCDTRLFEDVAYTMLVVENVTKRYGNWTALDSVGFTLQPGEIVGLLGPNGSGKTTLLRIISTYFLPQQGTVLVNGLDVRKDPVAVRRLIGYLPESNILYENMRVDLFLRFVGEAKGLTGDVLEERLLWVRDHCELAPLLNKKCGECSRGMRQRVAFAAALLSDPPILLLDEPTAGLDPLQSVAFRQLLHSLAANRVILFSSHLMAEVAATTQRVLLLHNGRLLADAPLTDDLRQAEKLEAFFLGTIRAKQADPSTA